MNSVTVFEYENIGAGAGEKLTPSQFAELKRLIVPSADSESDSGEPELCTSDVSACMSLCSRFGKEVIKVKNYVGVIALESGLVIEVLPKIGCDGLPGDAARARALVVEMLRSCRDLPYKALSRAKLGTAKTDLYEVFIRLFLDELGLLIKRGLRAGYVEREENENFLRGKIVFSEHLRRNFAHAERFFVRYDSYCFDRAENRLIKSTLLFLSGKSRDERNRKDIRRMLLELGEIPPSENMEGDFAKCESGRGLADYSAVTALCRVFLRRKSFTAYSGKSNATALLFPMERLFESFVYEKIRPEAERLGYGCDKQVRGSYLFEGGKFALRPDIVIYKRGGEKIVADTKWKRLSTDPKLNYGISQADTYQAYAYHTRLGKVKKVVLLYPHFGALDGLRVPDYRTRAGDDSVTVQVRTVDMYGYLFGENRGFLECVKSQADLIE